MTQANKKNRLQGGALLYFAWAGEANEQSRLLLDVIERHKRKMVRMTAAAMTRPSSESFLRAFRSCDTGRRTWVQTHSVAELGKGLGPVVGAGACVHADQSQRQTGNYLEESDRWHIGGHQFRLAWLAHGMHGDEAQPAFTRSIATVTMVMPLPVDVMNNLALRPWHSVAANHTFNARGSTGTGDYLSFFK